MEKKSDTEGFWDDSQKAGKIMQELEELRGEIKMLSDVETEIDETKELSEIISAEYVAEASSAKATAAKKEKEDLEIKISEIEKNLNKLEFKLLFSGEYDRKDAILSIHSGAGGVDAQDWAEMLMRMYLKWAEKNNFKAGIVDESRGQEAGIKSATIEISGPYAYGNLRSEAGVHRLVRLSPFNSDNLRQTSFALVEVMPIVEDIKEVAINPQDIRVDVFRSSGAGGQSVNTTDSAVRITHIPTNIVVSCQNERSQMQNKEQAMKILKARLHKKYLEDQEMEKAKLRGASVSAEWGSQIRSYVVHPYKLVKDHRTKHETANAEAVLEGNINEFIQHFLEWSKKKDNKN